ncbi:MAG: hypothetical protein LUQ65_05595 [Candidatus Helarchaeota archaeon]|nr:hypothetical protein [Candidatus Helarchaeota archaeon]
MPYGVIMVRWDDKLGVVLEGMYPKTLKMNEDHILRIFTTHAMGSGEASFLTMSIENLFIASYYTGLPEEGKSQFYVALFLDEKENGDSFEEPLLEITPLLIAHVKDKNFDNFLKKQFEDIQKLTTMTEEQRIAMIFRDPRRGLVLQKLGLGAIARDELRKWLSDQLGEEILDLEAILSPFFKTHMVEEFAVDNLQGQKVKCVFLIKDAFSIRSPVEKFYKMAKDGGGVKAEMKPVLEIYKQNVDAFFKEYKFQDADSKTIAEIAADPSQYNLLTILRDNFIERNQLPNIFQRDLDEITPYINDLIRFNVIDEIKDKRGNVWIFLKTDIVFPTFFPEYIVDSIRRRWQESNIAQKIAVKHLELLKSVYRGEEEEFLEEEAEVTGREEEEEALPKTKAAPRVVKEAIKEAVPKEAQAISDGELIKMIEQVNVLRKDAKEDIDNKDRDSALRKLDQAIDITKQLIAFGAVGQDKRLEKLEEVANSLRRLAEKDKGKKAEAVAPQPFPRATPRIPTAPKFVETPAAPSIDQQKLLREERDNAIASADRALTEGSFPDAIAFLEKAAVMSEKMGEKDKGNDIRRMADEIRRKLEKFK